MADHKTTPCCWCGEAPTVTDMCTLVFFECTPCGDMVRATTWAVARNIWNKRMGRLNARIKLLLVRDRKERKGHK